MAMGNAQVERQDIGREGNRWLRGSEGERRGRLDWVTDMHQAGPIENVARLVGGRSLDVSWRNRSRYRLRSETKGWWNHGPIHDLSRSYHIICCALFGTCLSFCWLVRWLTSAPTSAGFRRGHSTVTEQRSVAQPVTLMSFDGRLEDTVNGRLDSTVGWSVRRFR